MLGPRLGPEHQSANARNFDRPGWPETSPAILSAPPLCCPIRLRLGLPGLGRGKGCALEETITVTLDLPVLAPLSSTVRALEAARDAQADPKAKQALAMATALASRGLMETLARSLRPREGLAPKSESDHNP